MHIRRLTLTWLLAIWAALSAAQVSDSGSDEIFDPITVSIELPKQWLILQPGETVMFVADPFLDGMERETYQPPAEYRDLFEWIGEAWTSNWYALNGQILDVADGQVVYLAPSTNDETFDVLVWHNQKTGQYAAVGILLVCEGEAVELKPEKIGAEANPVFRVPTASNSGVQLFAVQQGGNGYSICLSGRPQNPLPDRCQGASFRTSRDKRFSKCDPWIKVATITMTAAIEAKLRRAGINTVALGIRIGARYDIFHRECVVTHMRIQDCYQCVNGVPQYVGSRIIVWRKRFWEVSPAWGAVLFPPPPPKAEPLACASSGNCPCP